MKKANFTNSVSRAKNVSYFFILLLSLTIQFTGTSQCTLACNGTVNISVDQNCEADLSLDMFLNAEGSSCPNGSFEIILKNHHGTVTIDRFDLVSGSGNVTWSSASAYIKETVQYMIRDKNSTNTCWGYANIEDKLPPVIKGGCGGSNTVPESILCCDAIDFGTPVVDECSGVANIDILNMETVKDCDLPDDVVKQIKRTIIATDKCGNTSSPCEQTLIIKRLFPLINCQEPVEADSIGLGCPSDLNFICGNLDEYTDTDGDGFPDPTIRGGGVPYLDKNGDGVFSYTDTNDNNIYDPGVDRPIGGDIYLFPLEYNGEPYNFSESVTGILDYCNMAVTVDDIVLGNSKCVTKILRMWTIREWHCGVESTKVCSQTIEIVDPEGPKITSAPHDFTASTNGYTCEARVRLPEIQATDVCAWVGQIDVFWKDSDSDLGGSVLDFDKASEHEKFVSLPEGTIEVKYVVYDECQNFTEHVLIVTVEDNTPPVAICDEHTVVSLTYDGLAEVPASALDDGSYDDCGLKKLLVRRMDPSCNCDDHYPKFDDHHYLGSYEDPDGRNHFYYLSKFKTFGHKAKKLSKAMGGYAVVYESKQEWDQVNSWIDGKLSDDDKYWMGLSDAKHEGIFEWENGHPFSSVGFNNDDKPNNDRYPWEPGFPISNRDNTNGALNDCVAANKGSSYEWRDMGPSAKAQFIIEIEDPCGFSGYAPFCCEDIGISQMVVFRAVDNWGNFNDCMVEVTTQDKFEPFVECPPDITVKCGFHYSTLDDFGKVVKGADNREAIYIPTKYLCSPTGSGSDGTPALWDGYAHDNCDVEVLEQDPDLSGLNQCGIGTIVRTWEAYHPNDVSNVARCWQYISYTFDGDNYPIYEMTIDDHETINMCLDIDNTAEDLSPDIYGYPEYPKVNGKPVAETECDLVGFTYDDQIFPFNDGTGDACFKVIRNWKIIDWCNPCTFDQTAKVDGVPCYRGPHNLVQIFKINNNVAPVLGLPCDDVVFCTYDGQCAEGKVDLCMTATDDCTETSNLHWSYTIEYFFTEDSGNYNHDSNSNDDGSFDDYTRSGSGGKARLRNADNEDLFPVGKHKITWVFEDKCGNRTSCNQVLKIENCKAPSPYCIDGLAIDLMPVGERDQVSGLFTEGMIEIWASDFDLGSSHPCGYEVINSFSEDPTDGFKVFTCEDFANSPLEVDVYSLVIVGEGEHETVISSYCTASLDVQNNMGIDCNLDGRPGSAIISGIIMTEDGEHVRDVQVNLMGSDQVAESTNDGGIYAFPSMDIGGSYSIDPEKNDDPMNGLSTLDIVLTQKHIIGLEALDSPYKMIAADVNNDRSISAADLVELRKMILGVYDGFANNDSWRFVSDDYTFSDPDHPFSENFTEQYDIDNLESDMAVDFTAIKVGDVNSSARINLMGETEPRSKERLRLAIPNMTYEPNDLVQVPVTLGADVNFVGYQFTMNFDESQLEYVGVNAGSIEMTSANIGTQQVRNGMITISWNDIDVVDANQNETLFILNFKAKTTNVLSSSLRISSDLTLAQAYSQNNEILDITLETSNSESVRKEFELFQNTPNPFTNVTEIGFTIPESANVTITIHNVTGKIIRTYQGEYNRGYNSILVSKDDIGVSGVVYYSLETDDFNATKRMVVIE